MPMDPSLAALDEQDEKDTPKEVDTPAPPVETPEDPTPPTIDYEKRYGDLRSEFDKRAQRDAERDAEHEEQLREYQEQLEALQQRRAPAPRYNDEYDDEDDLDTRAPDPMADPRFLAQLARVDRLEAQLNQKNEQDTLAQRQQEEHAYVDDALDDIEARFKVQLSERASTWIGREAFANRDPVTGQPDVEGAYAAFHEEKESWKKSWASGKHDAPGAPAAGPGAVEVPDLDDPEARADYLDKAFE